MTDIDINEEGFKILKIKEDLSSYMNNRLIDIEIDRKKIKSRLVALKVFEVQYIDIIQLFAPKCVIRRGVCAKFSNDQLLEILQEYPDGVNTETINNRVKDRFGPKHSVCTTRRRMKAIKDHGMAVSYRNADGTCYWKLTESTNVPLGVYIKDGIIEGI